MIAASTGAAVGPAVTWEEGWRGLVTARFESNRRRCDEAMDVGFGTPARRKPLALSSRRAYGRCYGETLGGV